MTKSDYKKTISQRAIVSLKGSSDFGEVTKFDEDGFSVLWAGEAHSGNYKYSELMKKDDDGALFVAEKRVIKPE